MEEKVLTDKDGEKRYVRGKLLGTGGFAKCFEVRSLSDQQIYAAKVIPKKEINEKRKRYKLLLQIKIHRMFRHENIVRFVEVFEDSDNIYIILQYCPFNTLKELVKRRKRILESEAKVYLLQMVKALDFIHRRAIIHRDLKLGNILVNHQMQLKFCDFGLSTKVNYIGEKKRTICGTPNYIAPEILEQQGHSYQSDIWSLGVIVYTLLYGKPPFESNTVEQTYENIRTNRYFFPDIGVSHSAKDLIKRILTTDPSKRLTLEQIRSHQFMHPIDQIPKMLPVYTLAIPLLNVAQLANSEDALKYNDANKRIQAFQDDNIHEKDQVNDLEKLLVGSDKDKKSIVLDFVYIRELLVSGDNLGYILTNGQIGVITLKDKTHKTQIVGKDGKASVVSGDKLKQIPSGCQEQLQILSNFGAYFSLRNRKPVAQMDSQDEVIILKKHLLLQDEQVTRLSNDIVQMFFKDNTSLILNLSDDRCLLYLDKQGGQSQIGYQTIESLPDLRLQKKAKKFSKVLSMISQQPK